MNPEAPISQPPAPELPATEQLTPTSVPPEEKPQLLYKSAKIGYIITLILLLITIAISVSDMGKILIIGTLGMFGLLIYGAIVILGITMFIFGLTYLIGKSTQVTNTILQTQSINKSLLWLSVFIGLGILLYGFTGLLISADVQIFQTQ